MGNDFITVTDEYGYKRAFNKNLILEVIQDELHTVIVIEPDYRIKSTQSFEEVLKLINEDSWDTV